MTTTRFILGKDATGSVSYTRNILQANYSISIAAGDLNSNKTFDLSVVETVLGTPAINMFVSVSPGTSLLIDWVQILPATGITPTKTNGELVTANAGFVIPKSAINLNFYAIGIPSGTGVTGFATFSFSS
jgi:hypothetical protein